jgi:phosphoglycerol transferase MdoB-like AlkP superfamily enzyme
LLKIRQAVTDKSNITAVLAIIIFLVLNALKLTLFNFYIIPNQSVEAFQYKFITSILLLLFLSPIILSIKPRGVFIALYILQSVYIVANISYFLYYHSYLNILQWSALFSEGFTAVKNFSAPLNIKMMIVFIDLPVFMYIVIRYARIYKSMKGRYFCKLLAAAVSVFFIVNIQMSVHEKGNFITTLASDKFKGESPIVQWYGTMANNIASVLTMGDENKLIECFSYGEKVVNEKESGNKPNFVIIQVESMDSNVINKRYKDTYIAPYLNSLANKYIYYPYVMSYHKGGSTSDSEFSMINSIEPLDVFPAIKLSSYDYSNSLLKRLTKSSYKNVAFHGNSKVFFNRDSAFPKMGFDEFYDVAGMNLKHVGWGAPDHELFKFASEKIKNQKEPYLAYIITMTSHGPFTNVSHYYHNNLYDDINDNTVKGYFNSISYVDNSIKNFIEDMQSERKNTYFFIIGDHTPNIDTEPYKQASFTHEGKYFEFVPLIIITPDNKNYREDKKVASFLDISPTILHNSGIPFEVKSNGQDLINQTDNSKKIPFKNGEYDRAFLYEEVKKLE